MYNTFTNCLDRHFQYVFGAFEDTRHLDRKTALARMQRAGRDEPIVTIDKLYDLRLVQAVAFHCERIDDDFHQFLSRSNQVNLEDTGETLELFLEVFGNRCQRALRYIARQVQYQHRVEA